MSGRFISLCPYQHFGSSGETSTRVDLMISLYLLSSLAATRVNGRKQPLSCLVKRTACLGQTQSTLTKGGEERTRRAELAEGSNSCLSMPPGSRARGSFRSVDFSAPCVQTAVAAHYTNTRMSAYRLTKCHTGLPNGMSLGLGAAMYVIPQNCLRGLAIGTAPPNWRSTLRRIMAKVCA